MTDVFNANRLNFFLSTDWSRPISGEFSFSGGDFYNFSQQYVGTQRRVSLSGILSQHKLRSEISGSYAQTFDPKKEVDGRFFTFSGRVTYFFTKALFLRAFAQTGFSRTYYDKTSTNKRYFISTLLGWEYSPKSHFFIAYNEDWRSSEEKLKLDDRVIVMKVSYLWNL